MFSRRRTEPEEPAERGRYRVDPVPSNHGPEHLAHLVEVQINLGTEKGWELLNVTHHQALVFLYWDTDPNG